MLLLNPDPALHSVGRAAGLVYTEEMASGHTVSNLVFPLLFSFRQWNQETGLLKQQIILIKMLKCLNQTWKSAGLSTLALGAELITDFTTFYLGTQLSDIEIFDNGTWLLNQDPFLLNKPGCAVTPCCSEAPAAVLLSLFPYNAHLHPHAVSQKPESAFNSN